MRRILLDDGGYVLIVYGASGVGIAIVAKSQTLLLGAISLIGLGVGVLSIGKIVRRYLNISKEKAK